MTSVETSLPLVVLIMGALGSILFFGFLLRSETRTQSALTRWTLIILRSALCLLAWLLIAQPKAVTTEEESIPVSAKLGIDVSQSMSLADQSGVFTSRWDSKIEPESLDEAIALAEVAKIRINLLSRRLADSSEERDRDLEKTVKILEQAREKAGAFDENSNLTRLLDPPLDSLAAAITQLNEIDPSNPIGDLDRSATLASQTATGLRRVATLAPRTTTAEEDVVPRIELVNRWIKRSQPTLEKLSKEWNLEVSTFSTDQTLLDQPLYPLQSELEIATTGGNRTHLYENLNQLAKRSEAAGRQLSLLISDGVDSTPVASGEFSADLRNQPLLVLPIGDPNTAPDVRIDSLVSPSRVREKDNFVAAVEVSSFNAGAETVSVSLLESGTTLASREVTLEGDGDTALVELEWKALGLGPREMRVEVSRIEGEDFFNNNVRPLNCTVIKDKYRVLVSDAFPRWETRYLQNLFNRDPSIEMTSIVFEPRHTYPGNNPIETPALPLALELWQKFDLVILGDVNPTQLTPDHQELLLEYVDTGGNLMIMAGENFMPMSFLDTPIEELLPMIQNRAEPAQGSLVIAPPENRSIDPMVKLDEAGTQSIWRTIFSMTPQYSLSAWNKAKESARAILVAQDQTTGTEYDFFAVQRFGKGRVSFAGAPCLHHLRFRYGDRYHAKFWGQVIRGMCVDSFGFEGDLLETRLDQQLWEPGAEVQGRVRLTGQDGGPIAGADFTAILIQDGDVVAEMSPRADPDRPGDYFVRFAKLEPGIYKLEYEGVEIEMLLEDESILDAEPVRFEILSTYLSEEAAFTLEEPSFWNEVNQLPLAATISPQTLPMVIEALDFKPETISRTSKRSIWDTWWLLLTIITIAGAEWFLRRINGLC